MSPDQNAVKASQDFQDQLKKIQDELNNYETNYQANLEKRQQKIASIYAERAKIIKEQADEVAYLIQRYQELKQLQARINTCISTFTCMMLFNYSVGQVLNDDSQEEWEDNFNKMYEVVFPSGEVEVMLEIFDSICLISPLLPLVFPTGKEDNDIHSYSYGQNGGVDTVAFMSKLNGYRQEYISGNLKQYCKNVCLSNCYEWMYDFDSDYASSIDKKCKALIKKVGDYTTTKDAVADIYDFIKSFDSERDIMRLKMLSAKSRKGICTNQIKILPKYYPKICPRYELWEAILMIINIICYQFGFIQTPTSEALTSTKASKSSDDTDGGQCFSIPKDYPKKCFEQYYDLDMNHMWNLTDYIQVDDHELRIEADKITGQTDDEVWMKDTEVCSDLKIICPDETGNGRVKYVNPTQPYTYQLLQDDTAPNESFSLAKIAVTKSKTMQWDVLYNLVQQLMKDETVKDASIYRVANSDLFYSFDYLVTTPEGYEQSYRISPTCQFMYQTILADAMQWRLVFPIDNTMTMSKINTNILTDMKETDINVLPQMIWADNLLQVSNDRSTKPPSFDNVDVVMTYVQPTSKSMTYENEYNYFSYSGKDSVFIYPDNNNKEDASMLFDKSNDDTSSTDNDTSSTTNTGETFKYRRNRFIR